MENLNIEKLKNHGLSFEEIEGIKRGIKDIKDGNIFEEEEFYSNLEKKIFSKNKSHV